LKAAIAYVVSGNGFLLQATLNAQRLGLAPFEIVHVIANSDCPALRRARDQGISSELVEAKSFPDRAGFDAAFGRALDACKGPIVIFNYNRLVSTAVVDRHRGRLINTHFSLLPAFPGFQPIRQAIASRPPQAGVTTHFIDRGTDTGPVIAQAAIPLTSAHTEITLGRDLFRLATALQLQTLAFAADNRLVLDASGRVSVEAARPAAGGFNPALEPPFNALPAAIWDKIWN
jgi:phosphoribosylglycinamide formyltransferase-1